MSEDAPPEAPNPYAPPRDAPAATPPRRSSFASERRPVLLVIGLSILTLGLYPSIWFLRRQPFLDAMTDKPLGPLPRAVLGLTVAATIGGVVLGALDAPPSVTNSLNMAVAVAALILGFRVAGILREEVQRRRLDLGVSSIAVFFFGCFYLQYKINRIADAIDAKPKKRKKKRSPPSPEPEPEPRAPSPEAPDDPRRD